MSNFTVGEVDLHSNPSTPQQLADARATLTRYHADDLTPMVFGDQLTKEQV